jgi:hypothetical protein
MNATGFKALPLGELKVIAVAQILGFNPDVGENGMLEVEMEVMDGCEELWKKFQEIKFQAAVRCDCCGHALKHACAVTHLPTGQGYWVGRECAYKVTNLQRYLGLLQMKSVALAERLACDQREGEFLAKHADAAPLIARAKASGLRLVKDMVEKLRRYGELSAKQLEFMAKAMDQDEQRRASATGTAPTGRQTLRGTILSAKEEPNRFAGRYGPETVTKLCVDLGNGVRVYGNKPDAAEVGKGDQIEFTATFEPSQKDPLFGFWKRPSKMTKI